MARSFNGSGDNGLYSGAVVSAVPLTIACWAYSAGGSVQGPVSLVDSLVTTVEAFTMSFNAANNVRAISQDGGVSKVAATTTTFTANTWFHAAAVFESSTSRSAFLNGGGKGTNTTSSVPAGIALTSVGRQDSVGKYLNGRLAEVGIWNVALTDGEVALLAQGFSPRLIRPDALVAYYPLIGRTSPEADLIGNQNLTLTGTSVVAHPRIINPSRPWNSMKATAAAAGQPIIKRMQTVPFLAGSLRQRNF